MTLPAAEGIDWERLSSLRLRAEELVSGVYAGAHRSLRHGGGVEFAGHRDYAPGDDLRRLDTRALLRHGRLLVREFQSDTQRSVFVVCDATRSMDYRSSPELPTKAEYAQLLCAGLLRLALAESDAMALSFLGGGGALPLAPRGGKMAYERCLAALSSTSASDQDLNEKTLLEAVVSIARRARPGAAIVVVTDGLDLPPNAEGELAALATGGRELAVVQLLDPRERNFDFEGPLRLKASRSERVVETDAGSARAGYLRALGALQSRWKSVLNAHGAGFVTSLTSEDPVAVLRRVIFTLQRRGETHDPMPRRLA